LLFVLPQLSSAGHCCKLIPVFSERVYPPKAGTGLFLQSFFSEGADGDKLITSFTQSNFITSSFKAIRPQKLSPLVMTGLLGVNRHYCVLRFHCNSTNTCWVLLAPFCQLWIKFSFITIIY